jgi:hypothetical protein
MWKHVRGALYLSVFFTLIILFVIAVIRADH